MHGRGTKAIDLFTKMKETGCIPDQVTFLALLYACSHSGLVDEGKIFLDMMTNEYGLEAWPEHYACAVDLLGRSNHISKAYEFIEAMPIEPTSVVWCALLGACQVHSDTQMGAIAAHKLLKLDPENPGHYVFVSNVFASSRRWEEVENVRLKMKERGLVKNPACSWIEVGNKLHSFVARDRLHPNSKEIYMKLNQIMERLEKEEGYVGDTKFVLHNVSEEEKLKMLHGHSERLSIAFGLIGTSEGTPIRITKNLQVCGDCHRFTQLVSKLFERKGCQPVPSLQRGVLFMWWFLVILHRQANLNYFNDALSQTTDKDLDC
ncbi:Pentatricopeptide repeat-containing protein [Acorus calamus]|uniref:Pentatricopeptide repeat-containing protein n=1 Tax=Acorus calamus TaxID=4465 RepID=A0AAV9E9L0_ACOCL|nr:Pentatricopeptide repeat-containing protein [Acorus calamus]